MSKISLQMYTVREFTKNAEDLKATIKKLSDIGFRKLQYTVPAFLESFEVKKLFDEYGIENDSIFCRSPVIGENMKRITDDCALFGTKYVRTDSIPKDLSSTAAGYDMFAEYLNKTTKPFEQYGIKLLYHFHSFEFIKFGDITGIDILLKNTNPQTVQIIPDTHWIQSGGKNPADFLEKYKDRYDYVHFKDFGLGAIGSTREARPIVFAPVGGGNLDWKNIISVCKKNGVKSYAIEQDDCYGRDPFACVEQSYQFMKVNGVESE